MAASADHAALRLWARHHLPLAGAALPRGSARLRAGRPVLRRYGGDDGALRRRRGARLHRALSHHAQPMGADHVRAPAAAAGGRARALRSVDSQGGDPRRSALPRRGEAPDDRMVGADPPRVLRGNRVQRGDSHRQRAMAAAARLGWARCGRHSPYLR